MSGTYESDGATRTRPGHEHKSGHEHRRGHGHGHAYERGGAPRCAPAVCPTLASPRPAQTRRIRALTPGSSRPSGATDTAVGRVRPRAHGSAHGPPEQLPDDHHYVLVVNKPPDCPPEQRGKASPVRTAHSTPRRTHTARAAHPHGTDAQHAQGSYARRTRHRTGARTHQARPLARRHDARQRPARRHRTKARGTTTRFVCTAYERVTTQFHRYSSERGQERPCPQPPSRLPSSYKEHPAITPEPVRRPIPLGLPPVPSPIPHRPRSARHACHACHHRNTPHACRLRFPRRACHVCHVCLARPICHARTTLVR